MKSYRQHIRKYEQEEKEAHKKSNLSYIHTYSDAIHTANKICVIRTFVRRLEAKLMHDNLIANNHL